MFNKTTIKSATKNIAVFFLVAAAALSTARSAEAFGVDGEANGSKEICAFSQQLQKSVSARQRFLVALDAVVGTANVSQNAVEQMYSNVKPAAYSDSDATPFAAKSQAGGLIDPLSADCLGCHDGVGASAVAADYRNNALSRRSRINSFKTDHPIGMDYQNYAAADSGFKPVDAGHRSMVFVNGKVGCLTCHNPLNPKRGHLVKSDRNSALCYTCHNK